MTIAQLDALPELLAMGFSHQTAIAALSSASGINGYRSDGQRRYRYGNTDKGFVVEVNSSYRIKSILVDKAIWEESKVVIAHAEQERPPTKVLSTIVFSYFELDGYARFGNWLQIRPLKTKLLASAPFGGNGFSLDAEDKFLGAPLPFLVEVKYQPSNLIWVEAIHSTQALQEARFLLSAWIKTPLVNAIQSFNWVVIDGVGPQLALGYMPTGLDEELTNATEFTDATNLKELNSIDLSVYVDEIVPGNRVIRVADFQVLKDRFDSLEIKDRDRYLRCCAAIHEAQINNRNSAQAILSMVSAVEALLDPTKRCPSCRSHVGINTAFKEFVARYVQPSEQARPTLEQIYGLRSALAHGGYSFLVDEPFMGLETSGWNPLHMASWIAKKGAVNWLLEHGRKNGSDVSI
jgi:hypothetical protein